MKNNSLLVEETPVSSYERPQIHRIESVMAITHGSKDQTDDSDTGGFKTTKPAGRKKL